MRNDARPIGEDSSLKSGEGPHGEESPGDSERPDGRDQFVRGRRSQIANSEGEPDQPDNKGPLIADDPVI
jgi:hypothetical protein